MTPVLTHTHDTGTGTDTHTYTDTGTGTDTYTDTVTVTDTHTDTDTETGTDTHTDTDTGTGTVRPLTQVSSICKIVEKAVHDQLTLYFNEQHLFSDDQHGFRRKHSSCTALLTITDEILKEMNNSEITLLTLIDLTRCFDVVNHDMLMEKLKLHQISTGWFRSYLDGHIQRVKSGDSLSDPYQLLLARFRVHV